MCPFLTDPNEIFESDEHLFAQLEEINLSLVEFVGEPALLSGSI